MILLAAVSEITTTTAPVYTGASEANDFWGKVIIALITALCSLFANNYLNRRKSKTEIAKERAEKVISPVFNLLEPYIFRYTPQLEGDINFLNAVHQAFDICKKERFLAGARLYFAVEFYINAPHNYDEKEKNFLSLSETLIQEYNEIQITYGFPVISEKIRDKKSWGKNNIIIKINLVMRYVEIFCYVVLTIIAVFMGLMLLIGVLISI